MSKTQLIVEFDEEGTFSAWKMIVSGRKSDQLARPVFPRHQPNYDFDHGVLVRIKALQRMRGLLPLAGEFARRK